MTAAATAVSALKPGSPGYRLAKHHEAMEKKAQGRALVREEIHDLIKRQPGDKFLSEKTERTWSEN